MKLGSRTLLGLGCLLLVVGAVSWRSATVSSTGSPDKPSSATRPPENSREIPLSMDDAQREITWDIEHHGNLLNRHGFAPWAAALARADREALRSLLAPSFTGQVLEETSAIRADNGFVNAVRSETNDRRGPALEPDSWCDRLLRYRRLYAMEPRTSIALMNLFPSRPGEMAGVWQGNCQLRIWGDIRPGEPGEIVLVLDFTILRPEEAMFQKGGWLLGCSIRESTVSSAPRPLFREVARARGLNVDRLHDNWTKGVKGTTTGGIYLADFDRDGRLDILVIDLNVCALYRGLAEGKFVDVTIDVGLPPRLLNPSGANLVAAFVDLDGDGWPDLILDKKIYRNEAGRFRDITRQSNFKLEGDVSGLAVADYDRDGKLDLYVARLASSRASSWLDGKGDGQGGNTLLRNLGGWQFEDVTDKAGVGGGGRSSFTALWFDANSDGWPDLYVPNEFGVGALFINGGNGTFVAQQLGTGPGDFGTMGATVGDVDNDGHPDLYVGNMYSKAGNRVINNVAPNTYSDAIMATLRSFVAGSQLHRGSGTSFERLGQKWRVAAVGWAYGPALVDLDNDGWLDLYATAGFISQDRTKPDG